MGCRGNNYFEGYVKVEIKTINPEKVLNLAYRLGISVWNVKKIDATTIEFCINIDDFKKLKHVARKTSAKVKIKRKVGTVFFINRFFKRKLFVLGIIFFVTTVYYLSTLVWIIEITGNKTVSTDKINRVLMDNGVKIGTSKSKLNLRKIESDIIKSLEELSIVNMSFDGVKVKVDVVERTMPPDIFNSDKPVDIIAVKDGVVSKVFCYKGTPLVKEGEYVKKGQVLISGDVLIVNKDTNQLEITKTVHSMGNVYAKVWYENFQEVVLNKVERVKTGQYIKNIYYIINNRKIYIKKHDANFKNYDKIENREKVIINGYEMPILKGEEIYYEINEIKYNYTVDEAFNIAAVKAEENIKRQMPQDVKVIDKKIDKIIEKNKVKARVLYITEEKISTEQHR